MPNFRAMRIRTVADRARADAARERRAQQERDDGIPDRHADADVRQPIELDLSCAGGPALTLRPVPGKVAWRAVDATGRTVRRATLKQILHAVADQLPRQQGARGFLG